MRTGVLSQTNLRLTVAAVFVTAAASMALCRKTPQQVVATAAGALDARSFEGRLADVVDHRPYHGTREPAPHALKRAAELRARWESGAAPGNARFAGAALLIAGRPEDAFETLSEALSRSPRDADLLAAIHDSDDAALLTDFSAAALQRSAEPRNLLLAYEAADRAWMLAGTQSAAWNRALAADRIGMTVFAAKAWREIAANEPSPQWKSEAEARWRDAFARTNSPPAMSLELFFYRESVARAIAGKPLTDRVAGDRLASDTAGSMRRLRGGAGKRAVAALKTYMRGRDAFDRNDFEEARQAYASAEAELGALGVPLALLARDQRIRSECSQGKPGCIDAMRTFRREIAAARRYPWLAARCAYGEGQTLYRQGRVYEAAEHLQHALAEFERFGDATAAGFMHILLANVYAAGGESDLALRHALEGLTCRTPEIRDRRRKILEDAIMLFLRHGYVASAELLLHDLAAASTTDASNVLEATLRGVIAFRRGDPRAASQHFARGRALLSTVKDDASRRDVQFRLAIAEAGSRLAPGNPILAELDASIATHEKTEYSAWLPQLLTERGAAYEGTNDLARAESDYRRAISILESREPRIDETVLALGLSAPGESPFDRAIRLLLRQGRVAGALSIAQRATALRISSLHARGAGVRDAFRTSRGGGDGIAELQKHLGPDRIAVAQHLLRDELITWTVDRGAIRAMRRRVRPDELVESTARLREDPAAVQRMSETLLRPWIESVPRGVTLFLQPPPELESVAFSMLTTRDGVPLVERNPATTAPSFRAFVRALGTDAARAGDVSAFFAAAPRPGHGLDPLPLASAEVRRASRWYAGAATESAATRAAFLDRAPSFAVVHFAGHVVVNTARPLFSALAFENGEMLYVHELDGSSFAHARLVVLSGCETGRAPRPTMSVANALLSQSVPSVVYTHWPVDDGVAQSFAIAFHRAIAAGETRAAAVRDAQLALRTNHPNDPGAWAAFALAGASGPLAEKGEDSWKNRSTREPAPRTAAANTN